MVSPGPGSHPGLCPQTAQGKETEGHKQAGERAVVEQRAGREQASARPPMGMEPGEMLTNAKAQAAMS